LPVFMSHGWYDAFLNHYQAFYREKNKVTLQSLHQHCMSATCKAREMLLPFVQAPQLALDEVRHPAYKTQIFDSILYGLIVHMRHAFNIKNMHVLYDQTKATTTPDLKRTIETLHNYKNPITVSDICTVHNDIRIDNVSSCDSKQEPIVQISDIIAGLFTYCANDLASGGKRLEPFLEKCCSDSNIIHKFRTHDITPEELGTENSNSSISMHAFQSMKR